MGWFRRAVKRIFSGKQQPSRPKQPPLRPTPPPRPDPPAGEYNGTHRGYGYKVVAWGKGSNEWGPEMRPMSTFNAVKSSHVTVQVDDLSVPKGKPGRTTHLTIHGPWRNLAHIDEFVEAAMDAPEYGEIYG